MLVHVRVCPSISAILMRVAVLNVSLILTAPQIRLALEINARTLVLEPVARTPIAK